MSNEEETKLDQLLIATARIEGSITSLTASVAKHETLLNGTGKQNPGLVVDVSLLNDSFSRLQKLLWLVVGSLISSGAALAIGWLKH